MTGLIECMARASLKGKIVESAEEVFRRQGFTATSIQDLVDAAGVPKGSFYNHFASKADLAADIVLRYADAIDTNDLCSDGRPVVERLHTHFENQFARNVESGVSYGCLIGTFANEVPVAGDVLRIAVHAALDRWTTSIASAIAEGQRLGQITQRTSSASLAAFLVDVFEGAVLRGKVTAAEFSLSERLDLALASLAP
ncbi:TetR/AcrR family transcriptional regulator [Streptomyces mirabilis]|uniref:TetR/AcrR family transcriptional regulator n=1 Tax=Streptomyces mirabilis TaxID=68239 RepID=UPI0036879D7F